MNYLSNCCGEPILDPDPHGHGKCSECYENCVPSNVSVMLTSEERNIKSHTNLLNSIKPKVPFNNLTN